MLKGTYLKSPIGVHIFAKGTPLIKILGTALHWLAIALTWLARLFADLRKYRGREPGGAGGA